MDNFDKYGEVLMDNVNESANKDWTFELVTISAAVIMLAGVALSSFS